jgi:hypothetical protein
VDHGLPFTFAIAMGVRKDEPELRDAIDDALLQHRAEIAAILDAYGVPRVADPLAARGMQ